MRGTRPARASVAEPRAGFVVLLLLLWRGNCATDKQESVGGAAECCDKRSVQTRKGSCHDDDHVDGSVICISTAFRARR